MRPLFKKFFEQIAQRSGQVKNARLAGVGSNLELKLNKALFGRLKASSFDLKRDLPTRFFSKLIQKADSFVDVNAQEGLYPILASRINRNCKVYAFEPQAEARSVMQSNLRKNGLVNTVQIERELLRKFNTGAILPVAVGKEYEAVRGHAAGEETPATRSSFDDYCSRNLIDHIDLIRINSPGSEREILQGAHKALQDTMPIVWIEGANLEGKLLVKDVLSFYGYQAYLLSDEGMILCNSDHLLGEVKSLIVVFVHEQHAYKVHPLTTSTTGSMKVNSREISFERENGLLVRKRVIATR